MLEEAGNVPDTSSQGEHEMVGWSAEVYEYSAEQLVHTAWEYFEAVYEGEYQSITTEVLNDDAQYISITKIFFLEEGMTVGDVLKEMPAPNEVEGYNFLRWEITDGHKCYIDSEYIDGEWVHQYVEWEEDMLIADYGCPWQLTAIYEEVGMSEADSQVYAFVNRMYTVALGRDPEKGGVEYWTKQLLAYEIDGAGIANGFITSPEFVSRNYSDAEYIAILYRTFFDREADSEGLAYWTNKLNEGFSREFMLAGFVNSDEFFSLCATFGISKGYMNEDGTAVNAGIYRFTERLYTKILERDGEKGGIEYWVKRIANKEDTPEVAAQSFFRSGEYLAKNTTNEKYVKTLYVTFLDREAEPAGLEYWLNLLSSGTSREQALNEFAQSTEFQGILAEYGL